MDWSIQSEDTIIPMFTVSNLFDVKLPEGWKQYAAPMFRVESNTQYDYMDFGQLLNTSLNDMYTYHKEKGIPFSTFINIKIMKDNKMLKIVDEYDIDWETKTVITKNVNMASTYRLIIYVNTLYINNLVSSIYGFAEEK